MVEFPDDLDRILEGVASGSLSPSAAAQHLRNGEVRYLDEFAVLDEAVAVAKEMGVAVKSFHDVGVAGIHRLARPLEELRSFDPDCLIVAAGMEGALPSVVAGLVAVPVVGLPTSTGYGLGGDGTAAILGMLQTCSPGLSVVNVDNGVGAGATAALIANRAALGRKVHTDGPEPGDPG